MIRRVFGLVLLVVLSFAASLAQQLRGDIWSSYRNYASPWLGELPSGAIRPALTPRVVCVLVRGLRLDESRTMPTLQMLRQRGLDATAALSPPTYRAPAWMGLMSGATPDIHGITRNDAFISPDEQVDTIFAEMRIANKNSAVVGSIGWNDWFGPDLGRFEEMIDPEPNLRDDTAINTAIQIVQTAQPPPQFVLVELSALEGLSRTQAINQAGPIPEPIVDAILSNTQVTTQTLADAITLTDARIQRLYSVLDFNTTTLIVISDRGRDEHGHDGGDDADVSRVPLIMAGAGIQPGGQDIVKQSAFAPTLAALLGIAMPAQTQDAPLIGNLETTHLQPLPVAAAPITPTNELSQVRPSDLTLAPMAAVMLDAAQQRVTFDEYWSEGMGEPRFAAETFQRYRVGIAGGNVTAFEQFQAELNAKREAAYEIRLTRERLQRLPILFAAALALIAFIGLLLQQYPLQPLIGTAAYYVVWLAIFTFVDRYRLSLSMFAEGQLEPFLSTIARTTSWLMLVTALLVALFTGRHKNLLDAAITAVNTLGLIAAVPLGLLIWFYWQWGLSFGWTLPSSGLLAAVLIGLTHIVAMSARLWADGPALPIAPIVFALAGLLHLLVRRRPRSGLHYERVKIK